MQNNNVTNDTKESSQQSANTASNTSVTTKNLTSDAVLDEVLSDLRTKINCFSGDVINAIKGAGAFTKNYSVNEQGGIVRTISSNDSTNNEDQWDLLIEAYTACNTANNRQALVPDYFKKLLILHTIQMICEDFKKTDRSTFNDFLLKTTTSNQNNSPSKTVKDLTTFLQKISDKNSDCKNIYNELHANNGTIFEHKSLSKKTNTYVEQLDKLLGNKTNNTEKSDNQLSNKTDEETVAKVAANIAALKKAEQKEGTEQEEKTKQEQFAKEQKEQAELAQKKQAELRNELNNLLGTYNSTCGEASNTNILDAEQNLKHKLTALKNLADGVCETFGEINRNNSCADQNIDNKSLLQYARTSVAEAQEKLNGNNSLKNISDALAKDMQRCDAKYRDILLNNFTTELPNLYVAGKEITDTFANRVLQYLKESGFAGSTTKCDDILKYFNNVNTEFLNNFGEIRGQEDNAKTAVEEFRNFFTDKKINQLSEIAKTLEKNSADLTTKLFICYLVLKDVITSETSPEKIIKMAKTLNDHTFVNKILGDTNSRNDIKFIQKRLSRLLKERQQLRDKKKEAATSNQQSDTTLDTIKQLILDANNNDDIIDKLKQLPKKLFYFTLVAILHIDKLPSSSNIINIDNVATLLESKDSNSAFLSLFEQQDITKISHLIKTIKELPSPKSKEENNADENTPLIVT